MPHKKKRIVKKRKTSASSTIPKTNSDKRRNNEFKILPASRSCKDERPRPSSSSKKSIGLVIYEDEELKCHPPHRVDIIIAPEVKNHKRRNVNKRYDNGGVKRIYTPFNRFANSSTRAADRNKFTTRMPQTHNRQMGLSSKEKSYLICSCQARSSRYLKLKHLAASAIKENKIFTIYGSCNAVRKALIERGWVEKITPNKMNLSKIRNGTFSNKSDVLSELERLLLSNLVEKNPPHFIWQSKESQNNTIIDMNKEYPAIINKLKVDALWTSKQGLCSSMKRNYWFHIENIAEVNAPRTYNSCDSCEIEGFVNDFQITACTSLLKWVLSMVANDRPIFMESGKISINVVIFALNRCKEYLFRKQHKDIDRSLHKASLGQWKAFMKKYYRIIAKDDVFASDKDNKLPLYLGYAKFLLKEMHKYRPQLSCEGCHNIWIIKPGHCSRGRGIRMAAQLSVIMNWLDKANAKYVVQKYIEEPLLIHDTKFDIRQYYLVTSTYPLVIWMYQDCYLKFSSQKYNLKNYHESIHLTNNAVQRKYKNHIGRHPDLPQNNMWDLNQYKEYLYSIGMNKVWDKIIYPGMKKSIIGIMLSCQDSLSVSKNRFELYGCDFILDKEYKPWLIEINSCPDLNPTTLVTAKICPAAVSDIIKVVIDYASDTKSPTGRFECIYRQPMTMPKYGCASDLVARGYTLHNDYFYKGTIEIKDSYDNADIAKERDIKAILDKLKRIYAADIMVEPDDIDSTTKKERCTQNTESDYELSEAASVINSQMDDLMDRIVSEHSDSTKLLPFKNHSNSMSPIDMSVTQSAKSEIDVKSLLKRSGSRFASADALSIQKSFRFSELEDETSGIKSIIGFNSRILLTKHSSDRIILNAKREEQAPTISYYDTLLRATSRIMSFMGEKEKEYLGSLTQPDQT